MSQSESESTDNLEKYRSDAGVESKTADISSDDHALKQAFGSSDEQKSFKFDAEIIAERISNWYDSDGATIREFLSNAETACIRRAKMELENDGKTVPTEITEVLEKAKTECGYEPVIEVTYNRKPDDTRLVVEDNGCGINVEEYQVLRNIGYSATHSQSGVGDGFGMGIMSFAQLTGTHGMMKFSTHSFPSEGREETAYSVAMYVTNLEFLDGEPSDYGTRFEFPAFAEDAKDINVPEKVAEFSEGMVVPVLYRDFDDSGNETGRSDDYLPRNLEDDYADDSLVITFENEYFKAVMSPDRKESNRGATTYNISQPIRRNTDSWSSNPKFEAPWDWDYRGKNEDGPIVSCPSDESLVGLVPKEDTKYDNLMPEMQEKCVALSRVPDDAIVMPEPASSRDSFMGGHDDFWKHVSQCLTDEWADVAAERFEQLDSWDDFLDMSREEKEGLFRAYSKFGPAYKNSEPDTIQDTLEDSLGVTVDKELGVRLHNSQGKVSVVRRGNNRAHTKNALTSKKIWKVIDEAPDGVYTAKTVSQKKADIVWGLGDTHVVRLTDSEESYDEYEDDWGWTPAKELPHQNLKEKLPELDDDVAERYENVSDSDSNNTKRSTTGGDGKNPETYRLKARTGTGSRKYFSKYKVSDLVEKLEDDEKFHAGSRSRYLVVRNDSESAKDVASHASRSYDVAATRVPKYVYDYLLGKQNVYKSYSAVQDDNAGVDVTLSDGTTTDIRDLPATDCLLNVGTDAQEHFADNLEDLVELFGYDADDFDRFTFVGRGDLKDSWDVDTDATVIKGGSGTIFYDFGDYTYKNISDDSLIRKDMLAGMDKDSDEYKALFEERRYSKPSGDKLKTLISIAQDAGLVD
jgi:hypothetical protein